MPITREVLYEQVWAEPMVEVAKRYGVSSSYLARICSVLRVPRPGRGYWARVTTGKSASKPRLLEARPGDEQIWAPDVPHWRRDAFAVEPELRPPTNVPTDSVKIAKSGKRHPILAGVDSIYRKGEHRRDGYLRPSRKNLPDINVSERSLDAALSVANALYKTLDARGQAPHCH